MIENPSYDRVLADQEDETKLPKFQLYQINRGDFIGSGAFGNVYKGTVFDETKEKTTVVAIKTLKERNAKIEFFKEALAVARLRHENIIQFLGVCEEANYLVFEFISGPPLKDYLKYLQLTKHQSVKNLVDFCFDICKGCAYLELMQCVHRDLAARNCMLTSTDPLKMKVKIGDFGLARTTTHKNYYRGVGMLPVKQMSPETFTELKFTSKSDVWAFGVLVWEIFTLGEDPYDQMNFEDIKEHVCFNMSTLEILETFPPLIKEILMHCWIYDAERRPTFDNLLTAFEKVKAENSLLEQKSLVEIDESFALKKPEREHSQTMWVITNFVSSKLEVFRWFGDFL